MACNGILEIHTILAKHEKGEQIFSITTFEFTQDDPNKDLPVSLYRSTNNKDHLGVYMGAYKTPEDARQEILKRDYTILEEEVTTVRTR